MKHLKTRIAAATALSLLMVEGASLAHAAPSAADSSSIDRIVTGPVPQGVIRLAQQGDATGSGIAETEEQRLLRERRERAEQAAPDTTNTDADAAAPAEAPAEEAPPARAEQPAEEAPPARAEQPPEETPAPRAEQPAEDAPAPTAEQPAEPEPEAPVRRAQPAEEAPPANADQPAVTEGQGDASREERVRQRREALRLQQQQESDGTAGSDAAPDAPAQAAEPVAPAAPADPQAPRQAQPAEPAQPGPAQPGAAEQVQPNETAREQRLRERREALRRLQQGDAPAGDAVEGGPVPQPGATETAPERAARPDAAGQPEVVEGAPENAAPVLDSQKPNRRSGERGTAGRDAGTAEQPAAPPVAATPAAPPPQTDAEAQADRPRADDIRSVREEEGRRVEDRPRRYERREGADVLSEIGSRVILELGNQLLIENNDRSRITRDAQEVYYEELPRGRVRETIVRPNGVTIVTVRDRYGEVIRRSRIAPDGRESVLVFVDEERLESRNRGQWRDPGADLPPLVIAIPYDEYIFDAERVDSNDDQAYYDFLEQPPVERVERLYSVDEVKRSARVRDSVRRIDLDTVTFDTGSAMIAEGQVDKLDGVANAMLRLLERNPAETFLIEGHTDAVGSDLSNLALSDERAEAVASALTQVFEIPAENLTTQGYGEQYLKIDTEAAERENRRVAIRRITPLVAPVASAQ